MILVIKKALAIVFLGVLCSGCATPPPEEICSAQWIGQRTDKAMAEFERDVRPMMRTFRRAARSLEKGNLGGLQAASLLRAVSNMGKRMENSRALKDVQLLGETCNDPDLMLTTFTRFMRDQGAPDQVINMLESARGLFPAEGSS